MVEKAKITSAVWFESKLLFLSIRSEFGTSVYIRSQFNFENCIAAAGWRLACFVCPCVFKQ